MNICNKVKAFNEKSESNHYESNTHSVTLSICKRRALLFSCLFILVSNIWAQPFLDLIQVRYMNALSSQPNTGNRSLNHFSVGTELPLKLGTETYLLFNPMYETWQLEYESADNSAQQVHGVVFPVTLLLPLKNSKWSLVFSSILRSNGDRLFKENTYQIGGASLFMYEKEQTKKIKVGAYMNAEYFGFFFMPLLGIDWRINESNYLFGLLPGRFTWEHKFKSKLYGGFTFRGVTNSYRLKNGHYIRVDDNQLSAFLDFYPFKNMNITVEPGYGFMRRLSTGTAQGVYHTNNLDDGWFIKVSAGYRMRL